MSAPTNESQCELEREKRKIKIWREKVEKHFSFIPNVKARERLIEEFVKKEREDEKKRIEFMRQERNALKKKKSERELEREREGA